MSVLEVLANGFNAACILLAGRNSVHTWWTGLVGCALFGWIFYETHLYADVTLQVFFLFTGVIGWWNWAPSRNQVALPVRRSPPSALASWALGGVAVTLGYAWLLHRYTDAYAPLPDSFVLAFSVIGQFSLMARRIETWWCWLLVNTVAVPLYFSRDLYLTAVLYTGFWVNALVALRHWRTLLDAVPNPLPQQASQSVAQPAVTVAQPAMAASQSVAQPAVAASQSIAQPAMAASPPVAPQPAVSSEQSP